VTDPTLLEKWAEEGESRFDEYPCLTCANLIDNFEETCRAFPKGIPKEILSNENDHKKPVEGDQGIQYEKDQEL